MTVDLNKLLQYSLTINFDPLVLELGNQKDEINAVKGTVASFGAQIDALKKLLDSMSPPSGDSGSPAFNLSDVLDLQGLIATLQNEVKNLQDQREKDQAKITDLTNRVEALEAVKIPPEVEQIGDVLNAARQATEAANNAAQDANNAKDKCNLATDVANSAADAANAAKSACDEGLKKCEDTLSKLGDIVDKHEGLMNDCAKAVDSAENAAKDATSAANDARAAAEEARNATAAANGAAAKASSIEAPAPVVGETITQTTVVTDSSLEPRVKNLEDALSSLKDNVANNYATKDDLDKTREDLLKEVDKLRQQLLHIREQIDILIKSGISPVQLSAPVEQAVTEPTEDQDDSEVLAALRREIVNLNARLSLLIARGEEDIRAAKMADAELNDRLKENLRKASQMEEGLAASISVLRGELEALRQRLVAEVVSNASRPQSAHSRPQSAISRPRSSHATRAGASASALANASSASDEIDAATDGKSTENTGSLADGFIPSNPVAAVRPASARVASAGSSRAASPSPTSSLAQISAASLGDLTPEEIDRLAQQLAAIRVELDVLCVKVEQLAKNRGIEGPHIDPSRLDEIAAIVLQLQGDNERMHTSLVDHDVAINNANAEIDDLRNKIMAINKALAASAAAAGAPLSMPQSTLADHPMFGPWVSAVTDSLAAICNVAKNSQKGTGLLSGDNSRVPGLLSSIGASKPQGKTNDDASDPSAMMRSVMDKMKEVASTSRPMMPLSEMNTIQALIKKAEGRIQEIEKMLPDIDATAKEGKEKAEEALRRLNSMDLKPIYDALRDLEVKKADKVDVEARLGELQNALDLIAQRMNQISDELANVLLLGQREEGVKTDRAALTGRQLLTGYKCMSCGDGLGLLETDRGDAIPYDGFHNHTKPNRSYMFAQSGGWNGSMTVDKEGYVLDMSGNGPLSEVSTPANSRPGSRMQTRTQRQVGGATSPVNRPRSSSATHRASSASYSVSVRGGNNDTSASDDAGLSTSRFLPNMTSTGNFQVLPNGHVIHKIARPSSRAAAMATGLSPNDAMAVESMAQSFRKQQAFLSTAASPTTGITYAIAGNEVVGAGVGPAASAGPTHTHPVTVGAAHVHAATRRALANANNTSNATHSDATLVGANTGVSEPNTPLGGDTERTRVTANQAMFEGGTRTVSDQGVPIKVIERKGLGTTNTGPSVVSVPTSTVDPNTDAANLHFYRAK